MRLVLVHVDDLRRARPSACEEEAAFLVPGGGRTVLMAPFCALDEVLGEMQAALGDLPEQRCDGCGEPLAALPP